MILFPSTHREKCVTAGGGERCHFLRTSSALASVMGRGLLGLVSLALSALSCGEWSLSHSWVLAHCHCGSLEGPSFILFYISFYSPSPPHPHYLSPLLIKHLFLICVIKYVHPCEICRVNVICMNCTVAVSYCSHSIPCFQDLSMLLHWVCFLQLP